jgi:hypothetical protein
MSNRNFDSRVIIQRIQNQNYARNLYTNQTGGNLIINNPQNSSADSSRFTTYTSGAQTEYFRGLIGGGETISVGGIVNIQPFLPSTIPSTPSPTPNTTVPDAPTITLVTAGNTQLTVTFTEGSDGGSAITDYEYSTDNGSTFTSASSTSSPIIITGLLNGTTYQVVIRAVNAVGMGALSNAVAGVPTYTVTSFTTVGSTAWTAPAGVTSVEYLVVGGGGGSGATHDGGAAGGGGGGMALTGALSVIPGNVYTVIVGDGGAGGISYSSANPGPGGIRETDGSPGNNSEFDTIIALGGGQGYRSRFNGTGTGGTAVTDPNIASIGGYGGSFNNGGGGGGGDSGNGSNGVVGAPRTGGAGGLGTSNSISGVSVTYGIGGSGGQAQSIDNAEAGTSNRGNGSSGPGTPFSSQRDGAKGGSGIVILKY